MRNTVLLASLFTAVAFHPVLAQEAPYSQTLDEQLMRVRSGQPAQPGKSPEAPPVQPTMPGYPASGPAPVTQEGRTLARDASTGELINSVGGDAIPALPLLIYTMPSGVKYITGGVGQEEIAQLNYVQADYNVQMLIASKKGEFMSGAGVRVTDSSGAEIVNVQNAGPYFYIALPEGHYTFDVTSAQGNSQSVKVKAAKTATKPVARFAE